MIDMVRFLTHLFIPHESNNHRAKVLHTEALLFYILFFAFFNISVHLIHNSAPNILGYATDIYSETLLADTNTKRQAQGLAPLSLNPTLSQAASAKASDMFANNYWAHNSPQGKTPWDFILSSGYKYSVAGENLAKNFSNSQAVVEAWMNSPTHKENILKPNYSEVGFAIVNGTLLGEETTLVVQMFGSKQNTKAVAKVQTPKNPVIPEISPVVPTSKPVEVPVASSEDTLNQAESSLSDSNSGSVIRPPVVLAGGGSGITVKPIIDITKLTKTTVLSFLLGLMIVLIIDAYLVTKRKLIRAAGHNSTHIIFFSALIVALTFVLRGSVL